MVCAVHLALRGNIQLVCKNDWNARVKADPNRIIIYSYHFIVAGSIYLSYILAYPCCGDTVGKDIEHILLICNI